MKLLIHSQTKVISSHTLLVYAYLSTPVLKLIHVRNGGPGNKIIRLFTGYIMDDAQYRANDTNDIAFRV